MSISTRCVGLHVEDSQVRRADASRVVAITIRRRWSTSRGLLSRQASDGQERREIGDVIPRRVLGPDAEQVVRQGERQGERAEHPRGTASIPSDARRDRRCRGSAHSAYRQSHDEHANRVRPTGHGSRIGRPLAAGKQRGHDDQCDGPPR